MVFDYKIIVQNRVDYTFQEVLTCTKITKYKNLCEIDYHLILKQFKLNIIKITQQIHFILSPGEIRTIYTHFELKPEILCVICCPQCFKQYTTGVVPLQCTWRHSPRSRPCGADLYVARHTHNGLNRVPKCLYTSQSFDSWLAFLLSRPQIDDCLHQTFANFRIPSIPLLACTIYMIAQPGIHFNLSFNPAITWCLPCILTGSIHLLTRLLVSIPVFLNRARN